MAWKKAISSMKDKLTMTPTERQLKDAMADELGGIPNAVLQEIAELTKHPVEYPMIMKMIWTNLMAPKAQYKRILRTLFVLEAIVKFGSSRAVQQVHDEVNRISILHDFSYLEEGEERGNGVRNKARYISETVSDFKVLDKERETAQSAKQKFVGISSDNYGGFRDDWRKEPRSDRSEGREPQMKIESPRGYAGRVSNPSTVMYVQPERTQLEQKVPALAPKAPTQAAQPSQAGYTQNVSAQSPNTAASHFVQSNQAQPASNYNNQQSAYLNQPPSQPPAFTNQPPVFTSQPPVFTSQPPASNNRPISNQSPSYTNQPPTYANQPPSYANQPPSYANQPPTQANQPPSYANQPPTYANQPPTYANQPPTYANQPPSYANQPPSYANQPPTQANQPPSYANQPPSYANQPPSYSNQPPSYANQPPSYANQPPSYANQPPSYANQPPSYANQPPTQASQPTYANQPYPANYGPPSSFSQQPVYTQPIYANQPAQYPQGGYPANPSHGQQPQANYLSAHGAKIRSNMSSEAPSLSQIRVDPNLLNQPAPVQQPKVRSKQELEAMFLDADALKTSLSRDTPYFNSYNSSLPMQEVDKRRMWNNKRKGLLLSGISLPGYQMLPVSISQPQSDHHYSKLQAFIHERDFQEPTSPQEFAIRNLSKTS